MASDTESNAPTTTHEPDASDSFEGLAPRIARSTLVFSGGANDALTEKICRYLHVEKGESEVRRFSDSETFVKIDENVRGANVFVVQSTCNPANDNLMALLLTIDALRRASAGRICAVIPYFGYARQDRKDQGRVALSAKLVANMIETAGADRVLTVDLHTGQIQGFFDIPVDNLLALTIITRHLKRHFDSENGVVVAADVGTVKRARAYAELIGLPMAFIDKRRPTANVSEVMHLVGEVEGKDCIICDDMVDTAGTICNAATAIHKRGARGIIACCTHPVLSGPALERIDASPIEKMIVTDTIPLTGESAKIEIISIAPLIGEAINRIHSRKSISSLFDDAR